jgi:hypothetical protein
MSAWGVSLSFRVICVLIMCAVELMHCQGLFGAVCVVRVSNAWRWSAASLVRMSGSDPICGP